MRIALFSTNQYPTPPIKEKVVYAPIWLTHYLAEGLKKKGHDVFLFASSDSTSKVKIVSNGLPSLMHNKKWLPAFQKASTTWKLLLRQNYEFLLVSKLLQMAQQREFDIIQFHAAHHFIHLSHLIKTPVCFSAHDPFNYPPSTKAVKMIYEAFNQNKAKNAFFISLSKTQRKPLPNLKYAGTVYNGIDTNFFRPLPSYKQQRKYLLFVGRIIPRKGLDIAIRVAQKTNHPLKIAGPVWGQEEYWKTKIKPHLSKNIAYQGMINQKQLVSLYQKAKALLMPTLLEESFGLVMAESMACGTPAIGFNRGAVPEVIKHNKTGFVVNNEKEMIEAVGKIDKIKREDCRQRVEKKFSLQVMVDGYEKIYQKILRKYGKG